MTVTNGLVALLTLDRSPEKPTQIFAGMASPAVSPHQGQRQSLRNGSMIAPRLPDNDVGMLLFVLVRA